MLRRPLPASLTYHASFGCWERISVMERAGLSRTILVIDDNTDAADLMAKILGKLGHRVDVAHSGGAGLEAAIATRPDAILLDIGMPGLNGFDVATRLRARGGFDDVL